MIFQHTWEKVLSGEKTQTRRIALPEPDGTGSFDCEMISYPMGIESVQRIRVNDDSWRTIYQVGKTYAVQPSRTAKAIARIRITDIRREDVRKISQADAKAEGFANEIEFWKTWYGMHDKYAFRNVAISIHEDVDRARQYLCNRNFYRGNVNDAWALTFELVKE